MKKNKTKRGSAFDVILTVIMVMFCATIILPFVHIFAVSFSDWGYAILGQISFWPKGLTLDNFRKLHDLGRAYGITILVTVMGTFLSLSVTAMAAFALSRRRLVGHKLFAVLMVIPLFFGAGLVPTYMLVSELGLLDNLWAMILPGMISSWNLLIMRSFFDAYPLENIEAGYLDGLNDAGVFFRLVLPASKAALAAIGLYYAVGYWNNYMNALLYIRTEELFPIQMILPNCNNYYCEGCGAYYNDPVKSACATAIVAAPIILIYPFIQNYFIKGVQVRFTKS